MLKLCNLRIRKIFTPQWEWEFVRFPKGGWQVALGRVLVYNDTAQQSMHPTSGSLRGLLASLWLRVLSALKHFTSPPTRG